MSDAPHPATLTVDIAVRRRMVRDLWRHNLRTLRGGAFLSYVTPGAILWLLSHSLVAAVVLVVLLLLGRIGWWWLVLTRNLSKRLPAGQVVSVGHTAGGDLVVRDTDEVWLPRGSARTVEQIGSVTYVHGRGVSTIVPSALLTDADVAFLEGHGAAPPAEPATEVSLDLPLAVVISQEVQAELVQARRRSYLRSGEWGITLAAPLMVLALMVFLAEPLTTLVVTALLLIPAALSLNTLQRSCAALRSGYPVGHTLQAGVDDSGLLLTTVHGALRLPWDGYQAHRLRGRTLELRTRKGRPLANLILPLELFTPDALQVLRTAVPKSF